VVGTAHETTTGVRAGINGNCVVGDRSALRGLRHAVTNLDGLYGLDAHERAGEEAIHLAIPVHVTAKSRGDAVGNDLGYAAEALPPSHAADAAWARAYAPQQAVDRFPLSVQRLLELSVVRPGPRRAAKLLADLDYYVMHPDQYETLMAKAG
jgi:hypothetical protein